MKGVEIGAAVSMLRRVEERVAEQLGRVPEKPGRYFRYREWLIHGALLRRLAAAGAFPGSRTVPGLDMPRAPLARAKRIARLSLAAVDLRRSARLEIRADALFLNTNLRSFYLGRSSPLTLKVGIRDAGNGDSAGTFGSSLDREIAARRYAGQFVPIPPIIEAGHVERKPFLLEPVVWGQRPCERTAGSVCDKLLPRFISLYEDHGYSFRTPSELLGSEGVLDRIGGSLDYLDADDAARSRIIGAARQLIDCPRGVALSFVHGDLAPNNLLVQPDGSVSVLDWERAGEGPVARDLYFLLREAPDRFAQVENAVRRSQEQFAVPNQICTLAEQLATVGAMALARWRDFEHQCVVGNRSRLDVRRQLRQYARLLHSLPADHPRLMAAA